MSAADPSVSNEAAGASTVGALAAAARSRLAGTCSDPDLTADWLLGHHLDCSRARLRAFPEARVPAERCRAIERDLDALAAGTPLAYLLGEWAFWSLTLRVTPATMVPRPETETLVETALAALPADRAVRAADLGTGCGAIALALASERPAWTVTATDSSPEALAVARANARRHGIDNVGFRQGHWLEALGGAEYDLIVANPPYIARDDRHLDRLAAEPRSALTAGSDGLDAIRAIVAAAPSHLARHGRLLIEHGYDQGDAVRQLVARAGFEAVTGIRDAGGRPRVVAARRGES